MQTKKYFLPLFFVAIAVFLLSACNLGVSKPDANLLPTLSLASETPVIPTNTAMPLPTSTITMPASSPEPILTPTSTSISPNNLFFDPTYATTTPTLQWQGCPGIAVTLIDTDAGDMLHVLRCDDGWEHDFGPLAKGTYAIGPNDKFLVYVSFSGIIYDARIGEPYLYTLFNLKKEEIFTALNKGVEPDFQISFVGEAPNYRLVLLERKYDQKRVYNLHPKVMY